MLINSNHKKTALLVFSLSAEKEIERKNIFDKNLRKANTTFFNLLINHTKKIARNSGVDVFWMDEHQQIGLDFATRFTNAFQKLFDFGYDNVISIGNDSPDLSLHTLTFAIDKLNSKKMVVGPTKDGGVYLLGINRNVFDKNKFLQLPWQTSFLQNGINKYASIKKVNVEFLDELIDLDSYKDLIQYCILNPLTNISCYAIAIITASKNVVFSIKNVAIPYYHIYSYVGLRAPPKF